MWLELSRNRFHLVEFLQLGRGGWDVVTMIDDLQNITSVGSVQGRVPDSPGNDTFVLEYDEEPLGCWLDQTW